MSTKIVIGVIAEDHSDVDVIFTLVSRINRKCKFKKKSRASNGCGRLRSKLEVWCRNFALEGVNRLIVVHDLDREKICDLDNFLKQKMKSCQINTQITVIPIEEIEAWLLSDMEAIKQIFTLKNSLKRIANPQMISSPKEHLEKLVYIASGREKRYLNTKHNQIIATKIDLCKLWNACPSFRSLHTFSLNLDN